MGGCVEVGTKSCKKHSDNMFWKKLQTLRKMTNQLIFNKFHITT